MHINEKDISLFLDNSLDPKKHKKLEKHFEICDKCKDRLIISQNFYSTLDSLEYDFELEGLEDKIMQKIKSIKPNEPAVYQEPFRISLPALSYISLAIFILSLLFAPVTDFVGRVYQDAMTYMLDEGIQFINIAKWKAVDIIRMWKSLELTGIAAGIILISGGIYFTVNRKAVRKA